MISNWSLSDILVVKNSGINISADSAPHFRNLGAKMI